MLAWPILQRLKQKLIDDGWGSISECERDQTFAGDDSNDEDYAEDDSDDDDDAEQRYAWAQGVVPIDRIWELDAQNATGSDVAPQSK
eukprot:SAG11_NODE_3415_length_2462_cov_2.146424_1_plen_86_part_10